MTQRTCETCRFLGDGEPTHCRRYPPTILVAGEHLKSFFPMVPLDWDCGEYKPKPKAKD